MTDYEYPICNVYRDFGYIIVEEELEFGRKKYYFRPIPRLGDWKTADHVKGEDRFEDHVVIFSGVNGGSRYYPSEGDLDEVPEKAIRAVEQHGYIVVTSLDSGWKSWAGRPEFDGSESYVDLSDAEPVLD